MIRSRIPPVLQTPPESLEVSPVNMPSRLFPITAAILCCGALAANAELPIAGSWKLNPDKSHLAGDVISFTHAAGKAVRFGEEGQSYIFVPNGPPATTVGGASATWQSKEDSTWVEDVKKGDMNLGTTTYTLSADGKKLMTEAQGTTPNGSPFDVKETYTRQSGSHGFYGKWMGTKVSGATESYTIQDNNDGSITWQIPELKAEVKLPLDGKDAHPEGPTVPASLMLAMRKLSAHKYRYDEKLNGKIVESGTMNVSADGKTITSIVTTTGSPVKSTAVYDKD
jgi:hypothetical protein